MSSLAYRKSRRQQRINKCAAMRAAKERKRLAASAGEPIRETRVVEMVIRDSHRTMRLIRMTAEPRERGWSRWMVAENGAQVGRRKFGNHAIARLIARSLQ